MNNVKDLGLGGRDFSLRQPENRGQRGSGTKPRGTTKCRDPG